MSKILFFFVADRLDTEFLCALLDTVEVPPGDMEELSDYALNALLAFNLHFDMPQENPLMNLLASKGATEKTLTEKLMLLLNRESEYRLDFFIVAQIT